ncbi:MAG TPA: hypothetical protein VN132_16100 [Bdellovibrio sp.]|nr:hypothetical protein [Bdellovibrio sp.]
MKKVTAITLLSLVFAHVASAGPCDGSWSCKSKSGKYAVEVQRCRYSNSIGNLESVKINGSDVKDAKLTSSYDSQSIGGDILALEISIPDDKNDARYLSLEVVGNEGRAIERIRYIPDT